MTVSLVPRDQPYGKRQENEAAAQEAGLATRAQQAPPRALPTVPKMALAAPPFDPQGFDALNAASPSQFGNLRGSSDSPLVDVLARSPNSQLRDLAARLRGY